MNRIAWMVAAASLMLAACTKLAVVNSPRETKDISLVMNAHYDAESKIRYMVSNDNTHVYLRFDTDNYATIMRVRKFGAIVHFDLEGKKKAPFWLKYPVYDQGPQGVPMDDDDIVQGGILQRNLFPPTTTAIWHAGEELRSIDLGVNAENLVCKAGLDSTDVLVYQVGVPFKMLGAERPEDLPDLNILLEIPAAAADQKPNSNDMNATATIPGGNMAGSGSMNPNMAGNGGMNPNMGGMSNTGMSAARPSSGPTAVRIWMQVNLSPSKAQ